MDKENFILFDDGAEDRIVGFGTNRNLEMLCSFDKIFMDGTFKVVPKFFYQLYSIHGYHKGEMFPLIFVMLPNKSEETYCLMFNLIIYILL